MPRLESTITIGSIRIPILVFGISVSVALHVGLLATLSHIHTGRGQLSATPPLMEFSRGQPIQIRIMSEQELQQRPPDEKTDRSISAPEPPEPVPPITPTALAEAETPSELVDRTVADGLEQDSESAWVRGLSVDWAAVVESFRSIEWASFFASSPVARGARDQVRSGTEDSASKEVSMLNGRSAPLEEDDHAPPDVASRPRTEPVSTDTPRGVGRGATVIDLPQPVYPRRSIRLEQEGTVIIEIKVRADGTVERVRLRRSSGHRLLDEAAIKAARNGRFSPAHQNGRPIEAIVVVPFEFILTTQKR